MTSPDGTGTMAVMRHLGFLLIAALVGCAHSGTKVDRDEEAEFSRYHRVGVPSFTDGRGQGALIAEGLSKGLQGLLYEPVDRKVLEQVLREYKPDPHYGLGVEALAVIQTKTSADAIIFGRMAPDWSAALITVMETEMGQPILRASVKPRGKKPFATADEVVKEILRVFADLH